MFCHNTHLRKIIPILRTVLGNTAFVLLCAFGQQGTVTLSYSALYWHLVNFLEVVGKRFNSSPHSSEKTTSYRRTNSGGQGKCSTAVTSPSCVALGSQEELYCSFVTNDSAPSSTPSASPITVPAPRPRRNAMVHIIGYR